MSAKELPGTAIAITKDLWFCLVDETFRAPNSSKSYVYFSSEKNLIYTAFFADFGPLNLGIMCTFCSQLQELLASSVREGKAVVVYASNPQSHSNFAVLVCAYQIFVLGYSAEKAYAPFMGRAPFIPFRDAAFCINTWPLFVIGTPCHVMLCFALLCCAVLCCAALCCAVLCCAVLCCVDRLIEAF